MINNNDQQIYSILPFIIWIISGGIIGGVSSSITRLSYWHDDLDQKKLCIGIMEDDKSTSIGRWNAFLSMISGALIGSAGSIGLTGVFCLINILHDKDDFTYDIYHIVKIFGISAIGGFCARKALPILGENLTSRVTNAEKRVSTVEKATESAQSKIDEFEKKSDESISIAENLQHELDRTKLELDKNNLEMTILKARFALSKERGVDKYVWNEALLGIEKLFSINNSIRICAILYARFSVESLDSSKPSNDSYYKAINILSLFLTNNDISQNDKSDVLYNRACYYCLLSECEPGNKEIHIEKCLNDLSESIKLKEENKSEAILENDFSSIKSNDRFTSMTKCHSH